MCFCRYCECRVLLVSILRSISKFKSSHWDWSMSMLVCSSIHKFLTYYITEINRGTKYQKKNFNLLRGKSCIFLTKPSFLHLSVLSFLPSLPSLSSWLLSNLINFYSLIYYTITPAAVDLFGVDTVVSVYTLDPPTVVATVNFNQGTFITLFLMKYNQWIITIHNNY